MAEAKSKSKAQVVCTLCDKPITTGKPVIIDDDPYHTDCAKAMEQSSGAAEEAEEEDEDEAEEADDEDTDGEDESDEDEEDEEEDEEPAPRTAKKVAAKAPAKSAKRVVAEEDDEDEDDDDDEDDDEDEDEEEEVVVKRPAKKAAPVAKASRRVVEEEDEEDEDEDEDDIEVDDEEEEEVVVTKKAKTTTKAAPVKATTKTKRAAADYEEEEEPEERPRKAKASTNGAVKKKAPAVDNSGWGNPATEGSKRYFVYQALKEVTKNDLAVADGPGKPENVIARAKRLHRDWAKASKTTLSEKDKNYSSMNVGWMYNHADELKLVMRRNEEAGTYRIFKAKDADAD